MALGIRTAPVLALCTAAAMAGPRDEPHYKADDQMDSAMAAMQRQKDPDKLASRSAVDSRVLVLGHDGQWRVEKPGSHGYHQDTATVLKRGQDGQLSVTQKGQGVKDRSANRYASDFEIVRRELIHAQQFTYEITDNWGRPEDLDRYKKGDCADKSFWLAAKLTEFGFSGVRVVLGHQEGAPAGHAWVELPVNGTDYILETTTEDPPLKKTEAAARYNTLNPPVAYFDRSGYHPLAAAR
jgi:hypothetical protein